MPTKTFILCSALVLGLAAPAAAQKAAPPQSADPVAQALRERGEAYHRADDAKQDPQEQRTTNALNAEILDQNDLAEMRDRANQAEYAKAEAEYQAELARVEAERLRIEAQVQAEEAARLRAQAEQAEAVLDSAQIDQGAKVAAAREKEAALARQEAELVAGAKLPPSRRDARGEVFTLAGDAFASGQAQLTAGAAASIKALGLYLAAVPGGAVQVLGHTDSQGEEAANQALSERRAQQVRATLVSAGLTRGRVDAQGVGESEPVADNANAAGRAKNRRVEIVVADNP